MFLSKMRLITALYLATALFCSETCLPARAPALSPDDRGEEAAPPVVDLEKQATLKEKLAGAAHVVAFSPDSKALAVGYSGNEGKLWDVRTAKEVRSLKAAGNFFAAAFSPDGKVLATGHLPGVGRPSVRLWDPGTGKELAALQGPDFSVSDLAFSPDGKILAAGGAPAYTGAVTDDSAVKLWDVATRKERATLTGHGRGTAALAFAPDGKVLAVAYFNVWGKGGGVKLWDVAAGKELATLPVGANSDVAFSPDGKLLATSGEVVRLWDVGTRKVRKTLKLGAGVGHLAFSPDGALLAASGYEEGGRVSPLPILRLWDVTTGKELVALKDLGSISSMAFSPDGKLLAAAGSGADVVLWEVKKRPASQKR